MVAVGAHSDRTGERWLHVAACSVVGGLGFLASAVVRSPGWELAALSLAAAGTLRAAGPFWALAGGLLCGAAAAAGIALINSAANVMGFATPYALGLLKDLTGGYAVGLVALASLPLTGAVVAP